VASCLLQEQEQNPGSLDRVWRSPRMGRCARNLPGLQRTVRLRSQLSKIPNTAMAASNHTPILTAVLACLVQMDSSGHPHICINVLAPDQSAHRSHADTVLPLCVLAVHCHARAPLTQHVHGLHAAHFNEHGLHWEQCSADGLHTTSFTAHGLHCALFTTHGLHTASSQGHGPHTTHCYVHGLHTSAHHGSSEPHTFVASNLP